MSELLKINVNEHVEKKNNLSYLSWAWAWAKVLEIDPNATWDAFEFDGFPASFAPDGSALVKTAVTIKGHTKTCWLPVMNHRNQAIKGPDAFAINTAIVRCLTKTISMHGLGLYIYAGEDLPMTDEDPPPPPAPEQPERKTKMAALDGIGDLLSEETRQVLRDWAIEAIHICKNESPEACIAFLRSKEMEGDERLYLDSQLPSDVRSAMRKVK